MTAPILFWNAVALEASGPRRKTDKGAFALQVREFFPDKTACPFRKS